MRVHVSLSGVVIKKLTYVYAVFGFNLPLMIEGIYHATIVYFSRFRQWG